MTYNIKNSHDNRKNKNNWINRKKKVLAIIKKYRPDILGLQEVYFDQLQFLASNLPEYSYQGVGREDGGRIGEFNPIFYKDLNIESNGTFWLSDTPNICSNTWGGLNRICTWINFPNCACYNTHFEHSKSRIRLKSIPLLLAKIKQYSSDKPLILIGDFNFGRNTKEYKIVAKTFQDASKMGLNNFNQFSITAHDFKGKKESLFSWNGQKIIDHIWLSGSIVVIKTFVVHDNIIGPFDIYPSDHWPVMADLRL